jgi:flagellar hook-length control protein FliK
MSLPSVASEPNVVAAPRRPGAPANRADGAPAQPADSFASALDNNGGDAPAPTDQPAQQPAATAQPAATPPSDPTNPAAKIQPAPASPSDVVAATVNVAVTDGAATVLDALALLAGIQVSTDGKTPKAGKADDKAPPDSVVPDSGAPVDTATVGATTAQTDASIPVPIVATVVPVPLISPTPANAPSGQTGAEAAGSAVTGIAAAGIAAAAIAAPVTVAAAGAAAAGATATLPDNAPALDASAAGKVQVAPQPVPDPTLVASASVPPPAGIDAKAMQLLAAARTGGGGKPIARAAANPTRGPETPRAVTTAATTDAAGSATGHPVATAPIQGNASDPQGDDAGTRKGTHGGSEATATDSGSAQPVALRSGIAATAILANASALLATHATDVSQSTGVAAQAVTAAATAPASLPQSVAAPAAAAAQVAASYVATVPLSGLAAEITAQARDGKNHFEIRLDPPDLGRIDVRLDVDRQGQVTSHLVVERSETLDLLRRDAPSLERALQSAGLKTDGGVEYSLRDQAFGRDRSPQNAPSTLVNSPLPNDELAPVATAQRSYWRLSGLGGGVDISV